jgi:large subunit ribosomal protein L17
MRHYKKGRKLGTDASHTKAMKKSLVANLFAYDRIKTTLERAKEIRGDVDRVITWAKRGDVHSRRLAIAKLGDKDLVAEIFSKVEQGMFKDRPGGYSRILRVGTRRGDSATIVIMELVQEPMVNKADKAANKGTSEKPAAGKAGAKAAAKKGKKGEKPAATEADEAAADEAAAADEPAADEAEGEAVEAAEGEAAEAEADEAVAEGDEAVAEAAEGEAATEAAEATDAAEAVEAVEAADTSAADTADAADEATDTTDEGVETDK